MNIVLAHGILDLSQFVFRVPLFGSPPEYFRGVRKLLEARHHQVIEPKVDVLGSLDERSKKLATLIDQQMPQGTLHVIAHSMGGLDMRRVLMNSSDPAAKRVAARTRSLTCIGTPHYGAPLANRTQPATGLLAEFLPAKLGAPKDLTTRTQLQDKDAGQVDYLHIACNARLAPRSELFDACALASGFAAGVTHDGVVDEPSARAELNGVLPPTPKHVQLPTWSADHGGAIGWERLPLGILSALDRPPAEHLARFTALIEMLEQKYPD